MFEEIRVSRSMGNTFNYKKNLHLLKEIQSGKAGLSVLNS